MMVTKVSIKHFKKLLMESIMRVRLTSSVKNFLDEALVFKRVASIFLFMKASLLAINSRGLDVALFISKKHKRFK